MNGWNYKSAWQAIWAAWQSRVKVMVRGDSHLHFDRSRSVRLTKRLAYRRFVPRFDACLAPGTWSREYFEHYGARPERIFFVPHVVDVDFMESESQRSSAARAELRRQWKLREDSFVFLFVGKFTETKRPLDFVKALCEAAKQRKGIQGLMVGDGPLRPACEEFVSSHDAPVTFAGFLNQSQIVRAYVCGDVLVLPSIGETWGMVVNEAMACGRPSLVSDRVGCGPDLVMAHETGVIFPHGNVTALSSAMINMAANPAQTTDMGRKAQSHLKKYSVQGAVDGVLHALHTTVGGDGGCMHAVTPLDTRYRADALIDVAVPASFHDHSGMAQFTRRQHHTRGFSVSFCPGCRGARTETGCAATARTFRYLRCSRRCSAWPTPFPCSGRTMLSGVSSAAGYFRRARLRRRCCWPCWG